MDPRPRKEKTDSKLKVSAARIASAIIDCDSSILSLLVVNQAGEVLAVGRSKRLAKDDYLDDGLVPKLGVLAKVIIGAADNEAGLFGDMEFLIGAFKKQKIVFIDLPEKKLTLALRMSRSVIAEYVCNKILKIVSETD
ncbi:MAG: hypothetical protein ABSA72_12530 [Nitrososphaerales archaeon]